ncbi:MAG TPA: hypothetical protein ENI80_10935 [Acidiferrobacteraceae bacterium]|nr:hypothetical protein [Acidiferrobacteraceae bacterium]
MIFCKSLIKKCALVKAINIVGLLLLSLLSPYTLADETAFSAVNKIAFVARQFTISQVGYYTGAKYYGKWQQPMTWTESSAGGTGVGVGAVSVGVSRKTRDREKGSTERLQQALEGFSMADLLRDKLSVELLNYKAVDIVTSDKVLPLYNETCPKSNNALSCHKSEWAKNEEEQENRLFEKQLAKMYGVNAVIYVDMGYWGFHIKKWDSQSWKEIFQRDPPAKKNVKGHVAAYVTVVMVDAQEGEILAKAVSYESRGGGKKEKENMVLNDLLSSDHEQLTPHFEKVAEKMAVSLLKQLKTKYDPWE